MRFCFEITENMYRLDSTVCKSLCFCGWVGACWHRCWSVVTRLPKRNQKHPPRQKCQPTLQDLGGVARVFFPVASPKPEKTFPPTAPHNFDAQHSTFSSPPLKRSGSLSCTGTSWLSVAALHSASTSTPQGCSLFRPFLPSSPPFCHFALLCLAPRRTCTQLICLVFGLTIQTFCAP